VKRKMKNAPTLGAPGGYLREHAYLVGVGVTSIVPGHRAWVADHCDACSFRSTRNRLMGRCLQCDKREAP
jgi:hypothetical protein